MNKKIASEIAIGIFVLVAVLIGSSIWFAGKENNVEKIETGKITSVEDVKNDIDIIDDTSIPNDRGISPGSSINENAEWQTYRNEVYGFEFNYPSVLIVKADGGGYFRLGKTKETNETYLEIIFGEESSDFDNTQAGYVDSILIGGIPARKFSDSEGLCDGPDLCLPAYVQINVAYKTKKYALIFYGSADLSEEQQQILSTFKFID